MDEAKQREIASKGGKAAHQKGTAHRFTTDEARAAGRKGGQVAHIRGTAHEFTPAEARDAGRKGGKAMRERHNVTPAPHEAPKATTEPSASENDATLAPSTPDPVIQRELVPLA
jgi:general stress protein YciG